jgi:hypothetical protein
MATFREGSDTPISLRALVDDRRASRPQRSSAAAPLRLFACCVVRDSLGGYQKSRGAHCLFVSWGGIRCQRWSRHPKTTALIKVAVHGNGWFGRQTHVDGTASCS